MKVKTQIGGKTCYIYDCGSADVLLIQPVDDHDIEVLDSEVEEIKRLSGRDFTLAAFKVDDWNADLSPWEAPPVFGNEAFAGGAEATLKYVVEELIPQLKGGKDPELYIGGYSLALFAGWILCSVGGVSDGSVQRGSGGIAVGLVPGLDRLCRSQ